MFPNTILHNLQQFQQRQITNACLHTSRLLGSFTVPKDLRKLGPLDGTNESLYRTTTKTVNPQMYKKTLKLIG